MLKVDCDDSPTYPRGFVNEIEVTEMDTTVTYHIPGKLYYDNHWFCQCCFPMYFTHRTAGPYFMYLIPAQHKQLNTNRPYIVRYKCFRAEYQRRRCRQNNARSIHRWFEQWAVQRIPSKKIFANDFNKAFHNRIYTGKYYMLNVLK